MLILVAFDPRSMSADITRPVSTKPSTALSKPRLLYFIGASKSIRGVYIVLNHIIKRHQKRRLRLKN